MFALELEIENGTKSTACYLSQDEHVTIGKAMHCQIRVPDSALSREHARLSLSPEGILLEDLGSTNGTFKNGTKISNTHLHDSADVFKIGSTCFRIRARMQEESRVFDCERGLKLLAQFHERLLEECDVDKLIDPKQADSLVDAFLHRIRSDVPLWCCLKSLKKRLLFEVGGYGPLQILLDDVDVSEIMVNGAHQVFVIKAGKMTPSSVRFLNDRSLLACMQRIVNRVGRSLDDAQPMVDARIPGLARVHAVMPPLSLQGPCLTLRKQSLMDLTLGSLVNKGSMTEACASLLHACVLKRLNIVVAGGTDSGKTTLLSALANLIPPQERVVVIEDTAELNITLPHRINLEARPANLEQRGGIAIRDLLKGSLRMRPDRILVGECRGGEAMDMLQAMNTGHDGCMTTCHASSARDTLSRLEAMYLLAGFDVPTRAIRQQIAAAVDVIVHVKRTSEGIRRVAAVCEVCGLEGETILTQEIMQTAPDGSLRETGLVPAFLRESA